VNEYVAVFFRGEHLLRFFPAPQARISTPDRGHVRMFGGVSFVVLNHFGGLSLMNDRALGTVPPVVAGWRYFLAGGNGFLVSAGIRQCVSQPELKKR
jgi:hypothetical protein